MENRFELFTSLIFKISKSILRIKSNKMESLGLKSIHVNCLYYLFNSKKDLTATDLCNMTGEDKALVSRAVSYLKENNYLVVDSLTEKAYRSPLKLSLEGIKVAKEISLIIDEVLNESSKGITEEEKIVMYKALSIIEKNLSVIVEKE